MEYVVNLSARAERDLAEIADYIGVRHSSAALRWFEGLEKAINSLERFPRRCRRAAEGRALHRMTRQILYGRSPHAYRVLFEIEEATHTVVMVAIGHGARDEWDPSRPNS
jgi:plasmid stabilization system protein ParE